MPGALSTWLCSILPASGTSIQASILYAITDFKFLIWMEVLVHSQPNRLLTTIICTTAQNTKP